MKQTLNPDRIVKAATELINAGTPLTFTNVARKLGTKSQALYPYFKDQSALRYAVMAAVLQQLGITLQKDLFGLSGRAAVMQFALTCRRLGIAHPRLAQFVATMPRGDSENAAVLAALQDVHAMLTTLVGQLVYHERIRLLGGRYLRNIIIGEVTNISSGWFTNPDLAQTDSFRWMIDRGIDDLVAADK